MLRKIFVLSIVVFSVGYSKIFVDGIGREVEISKKVERVISTVPSNTEIIVDMGLVNVLLGVDIYSEKISKELEGKGVLNTDRLNEERIIDLMPDLVITSQHSLSKGKESLKVFDEIGIPIYVMKTPKSLEEVKNSIDEIGNLLNENEKSDILKNRYVKELEKLVIQNKISKKRVYFEILNNPIYTTGNKTFLNDVIENAGGHNIFGDQEGWISPTLESVIEKNPEVILIGEDRKEIVEEIKNRAEWQEIDAIKNGRIYVIDEGINRPSPRVLKSLRQIKEVLSQ